MGGRRGARTRPDKRKGADGFRSFCLRGRIVFTTIAVLMGSPGPQTTRGGGTSVEHVSCDLQVTRSMPQDTKTCRSVRPQIVQSSMPTTYRAVHTACHRKNCDKHRSQIV